MIGSQINCLKHFQSKTNANGLSRRLLKSLSHTWLPCWTCWPSRRGTPSAPGSTCSPWSGGCPGWGATWCARRRGTGRRWRTSCARTERGRKKIGIPIKAFEFPTPHGLNSCSVGKALAHNNQNISKNKNNATIKVIAGNNLHLKS